MSLYPPTYFSPPPYEDSRSVEEFLEVVFNDSHLRHTLAHQLSQDVNISTDDVVQLSITGIDSEKLTILLSDIMSYCDYLTGHSSHSCIDLLIHALSNYESIFNDIYIQKRLLEKQDKQSSLAVIHWCELFSCCYTREERSQEHTTNDMQLPVAIPAKLILETAFEQLCDFTSRSLTNNFLLRQ